MTQGGSSESAYVSVIGLFEKLCDFQTTVNIGTVIVYTVIYVGQEYIYICGHLNAQHELVLPLVDMW